MKHRFVSSAWLAAVVVFADSVAAQTPPPPTVNDLKVVSLHKASENWTVRTSIWLVADVPGPVDADRPLSFVSLQPAHGSLKCEEMPADNDKPRQLCVYEPLTGFIGSDSFRYHAIYNKVSSAQAIVSIEVKSQGLRWELQTGTSQGLTSDTLAAGSSSLSKVPEVLGNLSQDLTFVLAWQVFHPRVKSFTTKGAPPAFAFSRSANFMVKTGLKAAETTGTVVDRGSLQDTAPAATPLTTVVGTRQFSADLSLDYNAVGPINGGTSFWELGLLGRAGFDANIEPTTSVREAQDRILQVIRTERGDFRFEAGVRFSLKQLHGEKSGTGTIAVDKSGKAFGPSNTDDLLQFELLWQRNNNLSNLTMPEGSAANRYVFRFVALPEIPGLPGHQRAMFGVEVTQALSGGPKTVRFLYGGAFELFKGRF